MSRRNRKGKLPPFVPIEKALLKSDAWRVLLNEARVAYIHLKLQVNYFYQETVVLTYKTMEPIMVHRKYARAIRQLVEFGFIHKEQIGGLYRRKNIFSFSQEWRKFEINRTKNSIGQVIPLAPSQGSTVIPSEVTKENSTNNGDPCLKSFARSSTSNGDPLSRICQGGEGIK